MFLLLTLLNAQLLSDRTAHDLTRQRMCSLVKPCGREIPKAGLILTLLRTLVLH